MAPDESLEAVISVIDNFSDELNELIDKLIAADLAISLVDDSNIDVDVNDSELDALIGKMALLSGTRAFGGMGGVDADADVGRASEKVTRSMNNMGDTASDAADSFDVTNLRMSDLHNMLARLVPVILVLIGAVPALIGAFVGLAAAAVAATAALAGIVGIGALGLAIQRGGMENIGEGLQSIMREIRDDFIEAFAPLAERLAPLMEDALDGVNRLFEAIAARGDVLVAFGDAARDLGGFVLETFPDFIAAVGRIASAFVPVFEHFADLMGQADIGQGFMEFMAEVLPAFSDFVQLVAAFIPHILGMSIGFLQVTNAILAFFNVLFDVLTLGGMLNQELGFLIATLLTLVSAIALANSQFLAMAVGGLARLGLAVQGMIVSMLELAGATTAAGVAASATSVAIATLIGVATLGAGLALIGVIGSITDRFNSMGGSIQNATKSLRDFQRVSNRVSGTNPYGVADVPERGTLSGGGMGRGSPEVVAVEDTDAAQQQLKNANFRMSRTGSSVE